MTDRVTSENFVAWNEEMLQRFDLEAFHNHPSRLVRYVEGARIGMLLKMLDCGPNDRVLEVGCGAGHLLARVNSGHRHGVDVSTSILEKARARLGPEVDLQAAAGEALPYPDASFDRVYCSEVLEHVLDPVPVLAEMRRVVRDDGVVVVSVPNERWINFAKRIVLGTGPFGRWLLGVGRGGYQMAERMDDAWHLRAFDAAMPRRYVGEQFRLERLRYVPSIFAPLRLVARLHPGPRR